MVIKFIKKNKKAIMIGIISGIITIILIYLANSAWLTYGPRPKITSNIIIYKNINLSYSQDLPTNLKNFYFLYYLGEKESTLIFMDSKAKEKINNGHGMIISPNFSICPECVIYTFNIKNLGNKKAKKIVIDIKSSTTLEILENNPKMEGKCGGMFESSGCYLVLENINENEETNFVLQTKRPTNIFITSCLVDERYGCDFKFVNIWGKIINLENEELMMNEERIIFPTLKNFKPSVYYYNPQNSSWVPLESKFSTSID